MSKEEKDFFSDENVTKGSDFWKPEKIGDSCVGYFLSKADRENKLKGDGSWQRIYVLVQEDGVQINVAGRIPTKEPNGRKVAIFPGFETLKIGQKCGVKFIEEIPAKQVGYNATKACRTYATDEFNEDLVQGALKEAFSATDGSGEAF